METCHGTEEVNEWQVKREECCDASKSQAVQGKPSARICRLGYYQLILGAHRPPPLPQSFKGLRKSDALNSQQEEELEPSGGQSFSSSPSSGIVMFAVVFCCCCCSHNSNSPSTSCSSRPLVCSSSRHTSRRLLVSSRHVCSHLLWQSSGSIGLPVVLICFSVFLESEQKQVNN
ncbi:hypothetical protein E2C01_058170 [Portunus trituberculatus]|uniref:Uncharacterized protein n=1 Tax=Portunus trituberculatus TaxID=210409 RepID=A0A5B7GVP1_PORTR|nr:hypothetical protein [Portunus trituberculatus]